MPTCISKYPITNSQYAIFTERTGYHQPAGKIFKTANSKSMGKIMRVNAPGAWEAGFHPWQDVNFSNPNQPVVCISYIEACKFCYWLNESYSAEERLFGRARLPSKELWDFAAFGSRNPSRDPNNWLTQTVEIISSKPYPAEIEYFGSRTNAPEFRICSVTYGNGVKKQGDMIILRA
jgi:formylglycine-generating enzyme required for sulfatase activity